MASGPRDAASEGATSEGAASRFTDLRTRVISAVAAAAVGLALVWAGGIWTALIAAVAGGVMIWEYRSVTLHGGGRAGDDVAFLLAAVAGGALLAELFSLRSALTWLFWALVGATLADVLAKRRRAALWGLAGGAYIGAAAIGLVYLRGLEQGFLTVVWVVVVVAAADIGGYFGGRLVGGPKLWPRVSPKKTWAGVIGGLVLAAVAGVGFGVAVAGAGAAWLALVAAGVAVVSQAGDLVESALKRHFGVKDAGRILPGHGGALDRFDGLAPAVIAVALASGAVGGSVVIG
jgi:phosphatidate cytidylyltransferase